ncbi:hypothetical protein N2152v2_002165 [Parachlorella kessleri]
MFDAEIHESTGGWTFRVDLEGLQEVVVQPLLGYIEKCGGGISPEPPDPSLLICWHQEQTAYLAARAIGVEGVSPLWVYACLKAGKLLPPEGKQHQPFPGPGLPAVLKDPASYVGCISGFAGPERWAWLTMMACMGMRVTKSLAPIGDGRSTHLVACSIEGKSEIEAARTFNMHIVDIRWPEDCLEQPATGG